MLWTDSDIITDADLSQIDSEVTSTVAALKPAVSINGDGSVCRQAWQECGPKMLAAIQMYSSYLAQPGMSSGHVAAVLNVGTPSRTYPRIRLNQVVAHDYNYSNSKSPIQMWASFTALTLLFRNASSRLGKDRLEEKMNRYRQEANNYWSVVKDNGLPMVYRPLEAPGALHGFNPGIWNNSAVSLITSNGAVGGSYDVAVTYCDQSLWVSADRKGNAESAPSSIISVPVTTNSVLRVSIASLNPPTGTADPVGTSQGIWAPLTATHWNIYVGPSGGPLYWQVTLPIATKTYTFASDPVLSGSVLQQGQWADINMVFHNIVNRG